MAGEGCWEALPSVLKLEDLLSPSWRKFETSFERERQSRYKKYITHCRHVHRLIVHGLLRCCGFFPLQCRVDSFHSATQYCPFCFTILWSLSASEPCGFFPLGDSVVSVLFRDVVDSFHFRAVWILSTRRLSVVRCVWRCCGFFPLQSRVDSFRSATQWCPFCFAMLWILSTSEPCGFFPLGGSSSLVSTSSSSSSSSSS